MLRRLRSALVPRSLHDVLGTIAFLVAVAGGTAYAANTIGSADIIDESILSQDIRNAQVTRGDIAANAVNSSRVADNALTGADIQESTLGRVPDAAALGGIPPAGYVQGRGELLSNRIVMQPADPQRELLDIPGLGSLLADCDEFSRVRFLNETDSDIDFWSDHDTTKPEGSILFIGSDRNVASGSSTNHTRDGGTVALGVGADPGPRRIATLQVFTLKQEEFDGASCGFQVQGTLWTSP